MSYSPQKIFSLVSRQANQLRFPSDGSPYFPCASGVNREISGISTEDSREGACKAFIAVHQNDYDSLITTIQTQARDLTSWGYELSEKFDDATVSWLSGDAQSLRAEYASMIEYPS